MSSWLLVMRRGLADPRPSSADERSAIRHHRWRGQPSLWRGIRTNATWCTVVSSLTRDLDREPGSRPEGRPAMAGGGVPCTRQSLRGLLLASLREITSVVRPACSRDAKQAAARKPSGVEPPAGLVQRVPGSQKGNTLFGGERDRLRRRILAPYKDDGRDPRHLSSADNLGVGEARQKEGARVGEREHIAHEVSTAGHLDCGGKVDPFRHYLAGNDLDYLLKRHASHPNAIRTRPHNNGHERPACANHRGQRSPAASRSRRDLPKCNAAQYP